MPEINELSDQDVEAYVAKIARQEVEKSRQTGSAPATPSEPAPIVINVGGKEFSFRDAQEASAVLSQTFTPAPPAAPVGQTVTEDTERGAAPKFGEKEKKHWTELFIADPIAAQEYIDEFRFGVKNPTEVMRNQMAAVHQIATQFTVDQFVGKHPDYYVCPENALVMQELVKDIGQGRIDPNIMDAAFALGSKNGRLKPAPQQTQQAPAAYNPYLAAPPVAGRNSTTSPAESFLADAENIPLDQIEAFLNRQH